MNDRRDWELLRKFVDSQSQPAFAELTRRYLGLVFGTALREMRDRTLAEDVTQAVFLILARKAPTFRRNIDLVSWLFDTCKLTAKNVRRDERRRQMRERKIAMEMQREVEIPQRHDAEIEDTALSEALSGLSRADRRAVLLRFVCGYSFQETGEAFGVSEDAARMRVDRAIEKLRRTLTKSSVGLSAAAIAAALHPHAGQAASTGLEARITELVLPHTPGALAGIPAHTIAQGVLKSMTLMKLTAAAVTCGLIVAGGAAYQGVARTSHINRSSASVRLAGVVSSPGGATAKSLATLPTGIPGTEAEAIALLRQVYQTYNAANTFSFTETAEGDASNNMPYTMRYTFQRPDKFEIQITRNGKTSRFVHRESELLNIPLDDPAHYTVAQIPTALSPHQYALRTADDKAYIVTLLQISKHAYETELFNTDTRPREFFLMGEPSVIDGMPVDNVIMRTLWDDKTGIVATTMISIGHADHLIRREVSQGTLPGIGARNHVITYSEIKIDQPIAPETFLFTPPAGVQEPAVTPIPPKYTFAEAWVNDREHNFTAKEFNGSKRYSLPTDQVPAEARQAAQDYVQIIYPALLKAVRKDGKLPPSLDSIQELDSYKPRLRDWSATETHRLDGTMISRPLYADNPPDGPHDVWAGYRVGKADGNYLQRVFVIGWDDGMVTFNTMGDLYQTKSQNGSAPPGAAGIPPSALQNKVAFPIRPH